MMPLRELLWLVWFSLRVRPDRVLLAAAAIALAVGSIVVLAALGGSMHAQIEQQFVKLGANSASIVMGPLDSKGLPNRLQLAPADAALIAKLDGVRGSASVQALKVATIGSEIGVQVRAQALAVSASYSDIAGIEIAEGRALLSTDVKLRTQVCVIGPKLAEDLKLAPRLGAQLRVGARWCQVVGVAVRRGEMFGTSQDNFLLLPETLLPGHASAAREGLIIVLRWTDSGQLPAKITQLRAALAGAHGRAFNDAKSVRIDSAESLRSAYDKMASGTRTLLIGLAGLMLALAGFAIASMMLSSVQERTREIGLHKAFGAARAQLLQQLLLESLGIATLGAITGLLVAQLLLALLSATLPFMPSFATPLSAVVGAIIFALLTALISAILPAARGAGLDPIEALRDV